MSKEKPTKRDLRKTEVGRTIIWRRGERRGGDGGIYHTTTKMNVYT